MPLTPAVTPADVQEMGRLFPALFNLTLQADLDALVQKAIDRADAWMAGHMGGNYNLQQFQWQITQQNEGQIYLALERLTRLLRAEKTYGTHYPYVQEDSPAFDALIEVDWGQQAMEALDLWVTVERQGPTAFALPIFTTSSPIPEGDCGQTGRESLEEFYGRLLDHARGVSDFPVQTVTR